VSVKLGASYFGVRNPKHVERDLDRMIEAGCNTVLHTFSENDFLFYRGTMQEIVELSKKKGLEVYIDPWGVGGVFGGEAFSRFVLECDDARQVLSNGRLAPAACPNNATFQQSMREWITAAVELGADVIFWDEPHFYVPSTEKVDELLIRSLGLEGISKSCGAPVGLQAGVWSCRCETCQSLFRKKYGYSLPKEINPDVQDFQNESLANFIKGMVEFAKGKGVKPALCLLPEWREPQTITRKWERFASLKALNIFGSDPYWMWAGKEFADYEIHVRRVKELAEKYGKEPQIWIQACKVKKGEEGKVRQAVEVAYKHGIQNIMAWSYLGTAYMSWIKSERPENSRSTVIGTFSLL
jgi:hypothetical protein